MPFEVRKLKVIADLDELFQSSDRDRRQTVISTIKEKIDSPFYRITEQRFKLWVSPFQCLPY